MSGDPIVEMKIPGLQIREAVPEDLVSVLPLIERFVEFGPPPWRDQESMIRKTEDSISEVFQNLPINGGVWIAVNPEGDVLGLIIVKIMQDYFTSESYAHISELVVDLRVEGQGLGSRLLKRAEDYTRSRGLKRMALEVFSENKSARSFYEKRGFVEEVCKYVRTLE
jgi:ribosomal protein S18 acetylase RimI-like enzyme